MKKWERLILALSGGIFIVGGMTGIITAVKYNTLADRCPDNQCSEPADRSLKGDVNALAVTTDVLLPVGGLLALTGMILSRTTVR